MALRSYTDDDGLEWRVWQVTPMGAGVPMLDASYRDGWLCFEQTDGSARRRLTMSEVPTGWDALPDDRLDLLRRLAEPTPRRVGPAGMSFGDTGAMEREKREKREGRDPEPRDDLDGERIDGERGADD